MTKDELVEVIKEMTVEELEEVIKLVDEQWNLKIRKLLGYDD